MEQQLSDIELLSVMFGTLATFGAVGFIGVLIADYIIEPVIALIDLIKAHGKEE